MTVQVTLFTETGKWYADATVELTAESYEFHKVLLARPGPLPGFARSAREWLAQGGYVVAWEVRADGPGVPRLLFPALLERPWAQALAGGR